MIIYEPVYKFEFTIRKKWIKKNTDKWLEMQVRLHNDILRTSEKACFSSRPVLLTDIKSNLDEKKNIKIKMTLEEPDYYVYDTFDLDYWLNIPKEIVSNYTLYTPQSRERII